MQLHIHYQNCKNTHAVKAVYICSYILIYIPDYMQLSLSTVVLNSRDRQGMYGMQHFRAPINKPHNSL